MLVRAIPHLSIIPETNSSRERIDVRCVTMISILFKPILNFNALEHLIEWRYWMKLYSEFIFNPFWQWLRAFAPKGSSISRATINRSFCISRLLEICAESRAISVSVLFCEKEVEKEDKKSLAIKGCPVCVRTCLKRFRQLCDFARIYGRGLTHPFPFIKTFIAELHNVAVGKRILQ